MKKLVLLMVVANLALAIMAEKTVAREPTTYTSIVDISSSVAATHDVNEARNASNFIKKALKGLRRKDRVVVRVLGEYGKNRNFKYQETVSKKLYPNKIRREVSLVISSIPSYIKQGTLQVNKSTNIIGFILDNQRHFDCPNGGTLFFVTDAIEASEFATLQTILNGKPAPTPPNLKGCTVYFLGTGHGHGNSSVKLTSALNKFWSAYFKSAGAKFISLPQY